MVPDEDPVAPPVWNVPSTEIAKGSDFLDASLLRWLLRKRITHTRNPKRTYVGPSAEGRGGAGVKPIDVTMWFMTGVLVGNKQMCRNVIRNNV